MTTNNSDSASRWSVAWKDVTRFLHSARIAMDREKKIWEDLEIDGREEVMLKAARLSNADRERGYEISLVSHLDTVTTRRPLYEAVLVFSYAIAEDAACSELGIDPRNAGGIEGWGGKLLKNRGRSWDGENGAGGVFGGLIGAIEVAGVRNGLAHGNGKISSGAKKRLEEEGYFAWSDDPNISLDYETTRIYRDRLRSLLRIGIGHDDSNGNY